jgi:excisionase family DNA binding protein
MGTRDIITLRQIEGSVDRRHEGRVDEPEVVQEPPRRLAVSVSEAATMLGISRGLAYELVHRGELPVIQLGRRLVVPIVALERLVAAASPLTSGPSDRTFEVR